MTSTSLKRKFRNLGTIGSIANPSTNSNSLNPALDNDQDDLPLSDLTKMAKILSSVPALRSVFISKLTFGIISYGPYRSDIETKNSSIRNEKIKAR